MRRISKVLSWVSPGVLVLGFAAGCSPPPTEPSAETAALESSLLTVDDVGGDFEEEGRHQFGASSDVAISMCPDSGFAFEEVGGVSVVLVWPTDDPDPMKLFETLRIVESDELDTLMTDLEAAVELCDGVEWTDYGDTWSWTPMELPEIGDRSVAVQSRTEVRRSNGSFDLNRTVWVADGDILVDIGLIDTLDGATDTPLISDEQLYQIAATAVSKLPD